ncbi:hypothetical protein EJ04DRAFT_558006 [Polyplosphaeria fusca]|uniref:Zn(2)-C6 fungal-type domain-containing protein n=1 Tax=Polyplosphaeria fusca TaxID=682080 RepID=A0A9P4RCV7_9PLEO|nr:hypothetical protein EJ04DRAFT_558006 [Polyplosphaeria fusca]
MASASPPAPVPETEFQSPPNGIWENGPVALARGRQAKDPNAHIVSYTVSSLDEFDTVLRAYLSNPPENPEHTECQLSFWIGTSFLVAPPHPAQNSHPQRPHPPPPPPPQQQQQQQQQQQHLHGLQHPQPPPGYQPANGIHPPQYSPHTYQSVADPAIALTLPQYATPAAINGASAKANRGPKVSMSILEALAPTPDPKEKMRKQRAIAKCCVEAIQKADGYRYSFHNCWNSREDDSFRFSYYCNDSLLNKDRAANGKGAKLGKRATKPVYDCRGVLSIKFSAIKQSLEVHYKHVPIHKTYEERAPPPRKDSKRRKFLEENDPEALIRIANRPKPPKPPEEQTPEKSKNKARREEEPKTATNSIESDLRAQSLRSLLELIQTDPDPDPTPEQPPEQSVPPHINNLVEEDPVPVQQPQTQPQVPQPRKKPRLACDICKAKKTKCDTSRPVCKTCFEKKRQCVYSDGPTEDRRQSVPATSSSAQHHESVRQAQAATTELSELERMKKELEEARARIQELEAEKTNTSSTPSQTPQIQAPQPQRQRVPPPQQQIQTSPQIQSPQYTHFNPQSYGLNRTMSQPNGLPQPPGNHQIHAPPTGFTPTNDTPTSYNRDFNWGTYYQYQPAQQHPQDQWGAGRPPGVFR